ncbi:MAG: PD40 domain-containing protein [Fidelibacterota bacterium]|nr:MAG: PD40 domain-containing protein [Candidatus Neomarinimicrobiota bacterium]
MRTKSTLFLCFLSTCIFSHTLWAQDDFPTLKGLYFGLQPPGMTPEVFAPGIISTDAHEGCSSFSGEGRLFLFARAGSTLDGILMMQQIDGVWSRPELAPFSAGEYDWDFMLAPDSRTVFVSSGRPISEDGLPEKEYRIWISEQLEEGWSESQLLPYPVNSGQHDSYPSVTEEGTLYFFSNRTGGFGEGDIYRSGKINGQYLEVENLGVPINTEYHEVDPFIAPDESYLVFCSEKPGGFGRADIYITFRKQGGVWERPVNMGDKINSPFAEYIPSVTPDGRYFFFTSNKSGNREIYWVDAKVLESYKSR